MTSTGSRIEGIDDESFRGEVSALIAAENELSIPLINVSGSIIETCQDTQ